MWKTINATQSSEFLQFPNAIDFALISESKINQDTFIELVYSSNTGLLGFCLRTSGRVITEQSSVILDAVYVRNLQLNEITGFENKLTGHQGYTGTINESPTQVFSVGNLSTSDFNKIDKVVIYPTPAK